MVKTRKAHLQERLANLHIEPKISNCNSLVRMKLFIESVHDATTFPETMDDIRELYPTKMDAVTMVNEYFYHQSKSAFINDE